MNPLQALARPEFAVLAAALIHFLWQGALLALLLAASKRLWRITGARQRYACSLAALVAMGLCPVITYFILAPQRTQPVATSASAVAIEPMESIAAEASAAALSLDELAHLAQPYFLALWLAGVLAFGLRLTCGFAGVWRIQRDRLPLSLELAARVEQLGRRLQMNALSRVFLSRHVAEALAVGFWRPVVLVPAAWVTEMPLVALEAVIAHELAHLRRFDLWVNLLQRVVETVLFYHPAVWWVSRQLRQEREMCCDELAVGATGARLAYVEALELVARERLAVVRPALAAGIRGESNMKLLERVRNVLGAGDEQASLWPAGLLALLLPLAMWGVTWGVLSPTPAAAVADDRDDDDGGDDDDDEGDDDDDEGERKVARKDGDQPRKEGERRDGDRPRKEGERRDGDQPRKEGERRDGDQPKKGPRDGEARREGPRDGDQVKKETRRDGDPVKKETRRDGDPVKKEIRRDGDSPKKVARDGDEARKDPVKKDVRNDEEGDAPRKKIVKEGDEPRKDDPKQVVKKEGSGDSKLEAMIRELRAENEKLRAELRELRGDKPVKPGDKEAAIDKTQAAAKEELIKKFAASPEKEALEKKLQIARAEDERAALEKKKLAVVQDQERAAIEKKQRIAAENEEQAAIEKKLRAAAEQKKRDAAERKEREFDRRREEERSAADKEKAELRK